MVASPDPCVFAAASVAGCAPQVGYVRGALSICQWGPQRFKAPEDADLTGTVALVTGE
jgi:hypothetical protein